MFSLSDTLDTSALTGQYAVSKRLQIQNFLSKDAADLLAGRLEGLPWRLALNSGPRHVDLPVDSLPSLGDARVTAIRAEVRKAAANGFQYLYETFPIADLKEAGELKEAALLEIFEFMNSSRVLTRLAEITGLQADFCDMQATRYRPGHFLTTHSDEAPGKNRRFAYVLSLSPIWRPTWGGQLQFLDEDGRVIEAFVPTYNALSVFTVPSPHHVSQVADFAPVDRLSLTGWFRTRS
ncbi:MAG: 2OG-Fe(II) oxygenase [Alphaproteobacteria bacterium]|nr:2OG-Fe(II) oxygenase [Alphaproteobacteria bacterium]